MKTSKLVERSLSEPGEPRRRAKVAILTALGVHGAILIVLLFQGCGQDPAVSGDEVANTNRPASVQVTNPALAERANMPVLATNAPSAVAVARSVGTVYTIAKGDTFTKLARSLLTTVSALREANPGVEPTRLRIGQKIHLLG